jgi:hypothetical protein
MVKEAIEDYWRYVADKEVNSRLVHVLDPAGSGRFELRHWRMVSVGDIVMVHKDEVFPADLLFLSAENEEGTCYVETMNLGMEAGTAWMDGVQARLGHARCMHIMHAWRYTGAAACLYCSFLDVHDPGGPESHKLKLAYRYVRERHRSAA